MRQFILIPLLCAAVSACGSASESHRVEYPELKNPKVENRTFSADMAMRIPEGEFLAPHAATFESAGGISCRYAEGSALASRVQDGKVVLSQIGPQKGSTCPLTVTMQLSHYLEAFSNY